MWNQQKRGSRLLLAAEMLLLGCLLSMSASDARGEKGSQIAITMPDVRPDHAEQYLCKAHRLPADPKGLYVTGFNPEADATRVHHMLMYGCQWPGVFQRDTPDFVWDCGEMQSSVGDDQPNSFERGPVCQGGAHIIYGWALDAPALKLPDGVGFKVGGLDNVINFLVVQVHYGHYHAFKMTPDLTDNSGLILDVKQNQAESGITRQAGVLLLLSVGQVTEGKSRHEIFCDIEEDIVIHPLRYRVHTHKLGTRVLGAKLGSGRRNRKQPNGAKDLILGIGDPQKPQMFYPIKETNITITKGDTVYASCEFNNNKSHVVNIGQTGDDEMCNFYLMYWTDNHKLLRKSNCISQNPPSVFSRLSSLW